MARNDGFLHTLKFVLHEHCRTTGTEGKIMLTRRYLAGSHDNNSAGEHAVNELLTGSEGGQVSVNRIETGCREAQSWQLKTRKICPELTCTLAQPALL